MPTSSGWLRGLVTVAWMAAMAASSPAGAQEPAPDDAVVYGRMNLSLEHARVAGSGADTKFVDDGSRLGLSALHGVGKELDAAVQVEGRLRHDPDRWSVKSRDTWIGIQGPSLGTARFGMMEGPLYHATYDEISMHNHDSGRSADHLLAENATGGRMGRALYYRAPFDGPVRIEMLHAFPVKDPATANAGNPRHDELALTYEAAAFRIAGGYAESRNLALDKAWTLAAFATAGNFVFAALYERSAVIPADGRAAYRDYGRLAIEYSVGRHELHANYGVAGSMSTTPSSGAAQATLAYNYNLTDRTKFYAFVTQIANSPQAAYGFLDHTPQGAASRSLAFGWRRNF